MQNFENIYHRFCVLAHKSCVPSFERIQEKSVELVTRKKFDDTHIVHRENTHFSFLALILEEVTNLNKNFKQNN